MTSAQNNNDCYIGSLYNDKYLNPSRYLMRILSSHKDKEHLYSTTYYALTFFGIVDLLAILPW